MYTWRVQTLIPHWLLVIETIATICQLCTLMLVALSLSLKSYVSLLKLTIQILFLLWSPGFVLTFQMKRSASQATCCSVLIVIGTVEVYCCTLGIISQLKCCPPIHYLGFKFCIAVFYRPPNSPASIFDTLSTFLASLNIPFLPFCFIRRF